MSDEPRPGRVASAFRNLPGRQNGHAPVGAAEQFPPLASYDASVPVAPPAAPPDELRLGGWLPAPADDTLIETDDASRGVHAITKKTDYWFEREVAVIERRAVEIATDWAAKGLPRHDVPRTGPLEPEQFLAMLCAQAFRK